MEISQATAMSAATAGLCSPTKARMDALIGSLAIAVLDGLDERFSLRASSLAMASRAKALIPSATGAVEMAVKNSRLVIVDLFLRHLVVGNRSLGGGSYFRSPFVVILYHGFIYLSRGLAKLFKKFFGTYYRIGGFSVSTFGIHRLTLSPWNIYIIVYSNIKVK